MFEYRLPVISTISPSFDGSLVFANSCIDLIKMIPKIYGFDNRPMDEQLCNIIRIMALVSVAVDRQFQEVRAVSMKNGGLRTDDNVWEVL